MEEDDDYTYDEVTGKKKLKMNILNKNKVGKHELDELFYDFE